MVLTRVDSSDDEAPRRFLRQSVFVLGAHREVKTARLVGCHIQKRYDVVFDLLHDG